MSDPLISDELSDEPSDFGSLRPGTRLGRYELLLPIARGGMARVWAARQHGTRGFQKLVAIKTILPHLADEPEFERMFLDEARIASGVHHPNVCEIYELGEERRTLYLAMEWVNGDSFSRALRASGKTEACDFGVAARVLADACAGAHAAHELEDDDGRKQNVVHRDLSPHNILINSDGFTKVCDFGVAKALNQLHEHTQAGQLKGKISYMAPEQVTGDPVDRRSDVFALGCVLFESTTGIRPFRGEGDHNVMQAIVNGELEPPSRFVRNYPQALERIVMRALGNIPNQRFASAELMRFALEEFLTKGPLVTQSHVATFVRSRLGDMLDRRRERIKQASADAQGGGPTWDPKSIPPMRDPVDQRSGVKPSQPGLMGRSAPPPSSRSIPPGDTTSFGRVSTDQILSVGNASSSSTIPQAPSALLNMGVITTPDNGTPIMSHESARASDAIKDAINASLLVTNPLEIKPLSEAPARAAIEARAMTAPGRDVPIPILSPLAPMTGPQPYDGSSGRNPLAMPLPAVEEAPPAGVGQYAMAALVGLLFAVAIGGAGLYYWKTMRQPVVVQVPAPTVAPLPSSLIAVTPASSSSAGKPGDSIAAAAAVAASSSAAPATSAPPPATSAKKKPKRDPTKEKDPSALPENPY